MDEGTASSTAKAVPLPLKGTVFPSSASCGGTFPRWGKVAACGRDGGERIATASLRTGFAMTKNRNDRFRRQYGTYMDG
jgi:hypothetical protein